MTDPGHMARFWDARAREDARFFVDNRQGYKQGDDDAFWRAGEEDLDRMLGLLGLQVGPQDRVLDVGCGVGRLTRVLAQRARQVTGLDVSAEMLAQARQNLAGTEDVGWVQGSGTDLAGIPDASVDVVISLVVFQHVPDPAITLGYVREIARVLAPGGWTAFQVSDDPELHARTFPRRRLQVLLGRAPKGQEDPAWRGSAVPLEDLRATLDAAGLDLTRLEGEGTQFCLVSARRRS